MTLRSQQTIEPANLKLALLFYPLFNGLFARGNVLSRILARFHQSSKRLKIHLGIHGAFRR